MEQSNFYLGKGAWRPPSRDGCITRSLITWQCSNRSIFFKYLFRMGLKITWLYINKNYKPLYAKNMKFGICTEYNIIGNANQESFQSNIQGHCLTSREWDQFRFQKLCKKLQVAGLIGTKCFILVPLKDWHPWSSLAGLPQIQSWTFSLATLLLSPFALIPQTWHTFSALPPPHLHLLFHLFGILSTRLPFHYSTLCHICLEDTVYLLRFDANFLSCARQRLF